MGYCVSETKMSKKCCYTIAGHQVPRYFTSLLCLAEDMHGSLTGTMDKLSANDALFFRLFILERLKDWRKTPVGRKSWTEYDNAVKRLLKIVVKDYETTDMAVDEAWIAEIGEDIKVPIA